MQRAAANICNGEPKANHAAPPPPPPRPPVKRALQIPIADSQTDNETKLGRTDGEPSADAVKAAGVWNAAEHGGRHAPRTYSADNGAKSGEDVRLVSEEVLGVREEGASVEVGGGRGRPPFVPKLNLKDASLLGVNPIP
jgi:hypothetical protein